jgi:16S rRNA (uracil1498-N3)-methyltransferase
MEITDSLFVIDTPMEVGEELDISGEEASHILQARRIRTGQVIFVTNGAGYCARVTIRCADSGQRYLRVKIDEVEHYPVSSPRLVLATALPKGERQAILLNMATQLGMNEFIPLDCDHSVVRFREKMTIRWHRLVTEACKQSRNCNFPVIRSGCSLDALITAVPEKVQFVVGDSHGESVEQISLNGSGDIEAFVLVVGPEGGFSERETMLLDQQNSLKLRLSNHILRTETAAVSMIAAVNQAIWSK